MLFSSLLFCLIFLWASGEPEPNINVNVLQKIDIHVNGKSASKTGGGSSNGLEITDDMDGEGTDVNPDYPDYPEYICVSPNFTITAGTEYGCPCSYYGAIPTDVAMPGRQCCQPSDCPNSNFTNLHVCGRSFSDNPGYHEACRNSTDALEFARQAWGDPATFSDENFVISCQEITYNNADGICYMEQYVPTWDCPINDGVVSVCYDQGNCQIGSQADDGAINLDSAVCQ